MPLDPEIAAILPLLSGAPPLREGTPASARAGFRLFTVDLRDPAHLAPVLSTEDVSYPAADGERAARIYRPHVDGPVPTILFVHGGGFVIGDIDTHEDHARLLSAEVGAVVFSIDYRLAPEHPFPAGHLDVVAALRHVVGIVGELGGDASRIAVAGDSAGGNLSAGAAIAARNEGLPLKAQLLLYPSTDFDADADHPSRVDNAAGYFLTADDMLWFRDCLLPDHTDVRASVLRHPDLSGVAPAIVATAEFDPLRDEGEAYATALEKAGVPVVAKRYDGLIHGFFGLPHLSAGARRATVEICADLKELLG
ncbi:MAG: Alpha/beta hydrolase fold-3 domain protein [Frankiales bacterium]|nr:Alpha/beta hydrolase fold-3 domain protein [Frankiales bacterium]